MSYHQNLHGVVQRVVRRHKNDDIDEWHLAPGKGFAVCGSEVFFGDKYKVYERAKEASKKRKLEIFGVMDEKVGLMLSPNMNYKKNAVLAFRHESGHKDEIVEKEVLRGAVVYRGYIGDSKNHAHEIARNHRASLSKRKGGNHD